MKFQFFNFCSSVIFKFYAITFLFALSCFSCKQGGDTAAFYHEFKLAKVAEANPRIAGIKQGEGFDKPVLKIDNTEALRELNLWENEEPDVWMSARYLVFEVWHDNDHCIYLKGSFYDTTESHSDIVFQGEKRQAASGKARPKITNKIGILPRLKTKVIYPLQYLDGQQVFGRRFPRQLKTTTHGHRIDRSEITKTTFRFDPYKKSFFTPEVEIAAIYLTSKLPEPYEELYEPYVDSLGQWAGKEWPGKTYSFDELKRVNDSLLASATDSAFKDQWSRYGGWKKLRFAATGFFRTHHDGDRWWLVDPEGYAFLSIGVDVLKPTATGTVSGQEDMFEWLPDGREKDLKNVDFYRENLKKVFGNEWRKSWEKITASLLRRYNFNTVGNWSDIDFAKNEKLPYVYPMHGFPSTKTLLYRDFPDVFSPEYHRQSKIFAQQLVEFKDDPLLIGYFLRNEPTWAFGFNNLAFEMFSTRTGSHTKSKFVQWVSRQYENIEDFNAAWKLGLNSFEQLEGKIFKTMPSAGAEKDFLAFSEVMIREYIDVPCKAIEAVDSVHLNLGLRYGTVSSELLYIASEKFDVFSINSYGYEPAETAEIAARTGKPVMIGEFHFGALDRGLPATGLGATVNQTDRGKAYRHYMETGFSRPEIIGIHWFTWVDQPVFGRFDGENYNIGMVDICNRPYPELAEAATLTNGRLYDVATGKAAIFDGEITDIPLVR